MSDVPDGITDAMNAQYKRDNHMTNPLDQIERLQQRVTELEQLVVGLQYARQTDTPTVAPADVWHERNDEACRKDTPQSDTAGGDAVIAAIANVGAPDNNISWLQAECILAAIKAGKVPGISADHYPIGPDAYIDIDGDILTVGEAIKSWNSDIKERDDLRKELETVKQQLADAMTVANRAGEYRAQIENAKIEHQTDVGKCSATINTLRQQLVEAREIAKIAADSRDELLNRVEQLEVLHRNQITAIKGRQEESARLRESLERYKAFHACFADGGINLYNVHDMAGTLRDKWLAARKEGGG